MPLARIRLQGEGQPDFRPHAQARITLSALLENCSAFCHDFRAILAS